MKVRLGLAVVLMVLVGVLIIAYFSPSQKFVRAGISLQEALSDEAGLFAPVVPGRAFEFPRDHGPHPEYKTEWWYFTGNLQSDSGEEFGYQLTIFRVGVASAAETTSESAWSTEALFMGHFALSRPSKKQFFTFERLSRGAVELAGAKPDGEQIWLEDWLIERVEGAEPGWRLRAKAVDEKKGPVDIDLILQESKPLVLQGEGGYSRKGPRPEHASYYVAQTRLTASGQVSFGEDSFDVQGSSWFDHEWSSEAMAEGLVGWDWFSLQLSNGTDLMLYLLRYEDGRIEPASSGSLIDQDGAKRNLAVQDFEVVTLAEFRHSSGATYPSHWRIKVPSEELNIEVKPVMADQVMVGRVPYWEGAVRVAGQKGGADISGVGFVELTGY